VTDVTEDRDQAGAELSAADEQLLRELTERARTGGLKLTGEGGLLGRLTKMVVEGALEGELDDHLGYGKHDPEGRDGGNSRNGHRAKTVLTDTGPVEISVPRDRDSSFEPKIVTKSLVTRGVVAFARESGVRRRSWLGLGVLWCRACRDWRVAG
jgi:putative transposase